MKKYYVYRITDIITNEFYIGSRGCTGPIEDDPYMGSPHVWKPNIKNLKKEIIKIFKKSENAILFERKIILQNISHPLNRNYSIPHPSITRESLILAKDETGRTVSISVNDPLFGKKYVGYTKGFVVVRNDAGETFQTTIDDPKYISGEYKHVGTYGKSKENHPNWDKIWVNDGILQKFVNKDKLKNLLNSGWIIGTLQKGQQTNSSHTDTIWVSLDGVSIRINKAQLNEYLDKGYKKGRGKLKKYERQKK